MRKNLLIAVLVLLYSNTMNAQAPAWVWSKSVGARLDNQSKVCAVKDAAGGIIVSGQFDSNAPFGSNNLAVVGTIDLYVTKYDQTGTAQWAKGFGGISNIMFPGGCVIDAAGNTYLAGAYSFGMTINGVNYYSAGDKDGYIIKLDPNGAVVWVRSFGAAAAQEFNSIAISGNKIYVAGAYSGSFSAGSINLPASNNNSADAMVIALDTAGNALWAATGGGSDQDYFNSVSASSSEVYLCGSVRGATASFGSTNLTGSGSADDILVARVNATSGNFDLVKRFGSTSTDQGTCVGYDSYGNIYVSGNFLGTVSFGGPANITSNGTNTYSDGFLVKLNSAGWGLWACKQGGASDDVVTGMEVGINGYIYLCGYYSNGVGTLSSTTTSVTLPSIGGADGFAAKYNPNGGILWGIKFGNTSDDRPKAIISDNNGYCYVLGNFFGALTLGSLNPVNSLPTNIATYIGRLNGFTTGMQEVKANYNFLLYPNPTTGQVNIELPEGKYMQEVDVYSINGQRVHHTELSLPLKSTSLNLAGLTTGIYQVKVLTPDGYANKAIEIK